MSWIFLLLGALALITFKIRNNIKIDLVNICLEMAVIICYMLSGVLI